VESNLRISLPEFTPDGKGSKGDELLKASMAAVSAGWFLGLPAAAASVALPSVPTLTVKVT
jgi:hypothetical protein